MPRSKEQQARFDGLMERIAEHGNVSMAAREMGMSQQAADRMFQRARRDLGEQAR